MDVSASEEVCLGVDAGEADQAGPREPDSNGSFLCFRGCTCEPPAQHILLGGETALLSCSAAASAQPLDLLGLLHLLCSGSSHKANGLSPSALQKQI